MSYKNIDIHKKLARGFSSTSVSTADIINSTSYNASFLTGRGIFIAHRQKLSCSTAVSDYIETETTSGGLTMIKSMFNNTLSCYLKSVSNPYQELTTFTRSYESDRKISIVIGLFLYLVN
jgi:hypothetical protein